MLEEESVNKFLSRAARMYISYKLMYKRKIEKADSVCAYVRVSTNLTDGKTTALKCQYSLYEFMHL